MAKGFIYPAGIAFAWRDLSEAVDAWEASPNASTDEYLVIKWNRFREALFDFEARTESGPVNTTNSTSF